MCRLYRICPRCAVILVSEEVVNLELSWDFNRYIEYGDVTFVVIYLYRFFCFSHPNVSHISLKKQRWNMNTTQKHTLLHIECIKS